MVPSVFDWLWQAVSLFAGTFVQEDAAILAGAYLVVAKGHPPALAFAALLSGVVAGDFAIYGLGALARRWKRLGWLSSRIDAASAQSWLDRRLIVAVAVSRILPTLSFPTFAACGWLGIPFRRFALAALASATVYVAVTFGLLLTFGRSMPSWASTYGWLALAGVMAGIWLARHALSRRRQRRFLTRPTRLERRPPAPLAVHEGMPALDRHKLRVAFSERIPPVIYYTPILLQWLWLAVRYRSLTLPTAANPRIEAGGLIGESKSDCMALAAGAAAPWLARTLAIDCRGQPERDLGQARLALARAGLDYPVIAKPDIGWRGFGVRKVESEAELADYLSGFPAGQRLILQDFVPWHGEAGVFFVRRPGRTRGEIFSLTLRYFPFVVGDGRATLRDLILASPRMRWKRKLLFEMHRDRLDTVPSADEPIRLAIVGSNRVGGLYVDGARHISPALIHRIDAIAGAIPEFHFGRFDLRFRSIEELEAGEAFSIIEINGAGAEAVHIWDPDVPLPKAYRVLFEQQSAMFAIGAANRRRGFAPLSPLELIRCQRRQQRLLPIYPISG